MRTDAYGTLLGADVCPSSVCFKEEGTYAIKDPRNQHPAAVCRINPPGQEEEGIPLTTDRNPRQGLHLCLPQNRPRHSVLEKGRYDGTHLAYWQDRWNS